MSIERGIDTFVIDTSTLILSDPNPIAQGGNAFVYIVKDSEGTEYVAKVGKRPMSSYQEEKSFIRELMILSKINSSCTISLKGFSFSPNFQNGLNVNKFPTVIMEKASQGSIRMKLLQCIKNIPDPKWTPTKRMIALAGTAFGMKYLHSSHIIHRDLKPDNVLLNDNLHPKITDFGLSKIQYDDYQSLVDQGTLFYLAPDIIRGDRSYTNSVDVYAYGIMAFEIVTLQVPYKVTGNIFSIINEVCRGRRPIIPPTMNSNLKKLISSCWSGDRAERPTFAQIFDDLSKPDFLIPGVDIKEYNDYLNSLKADFIPLCLDPNVQSIINQANKGNIQMMKEAANGFYEGIGKFPFDKDQALKYYRMHTIATSDSLDVSPKFIEGVTKKATLAQSEVVDFSYHNLPPRPPTDEELLESLTPEIKSKINSKVKSHDLFEIGNNFQNGVYPFPQNYQLSSYFFRKAFAVLNNETEYKRIITETEVCKDPLARSRSNTVVVSSQNISVTPIDFRPLCFQALKRDIPHVNILVYGNITSISPAVKSIKSNQNAPEIDVDNNFMRYDIEGKGITIFQAKNSDQIFLDTVMNFIKERCSPSCDPYQKLLMCFCCITPSNDPNLDEKRAQIIKSISKLIYTATFITSIADNAFIDLLKKNLNGIVYRKEKKIDGRKLKKNILIFDLKLCAQKTCTCLFQDFINLFPHLSPL